MSEVGYDGAYTFVYSPRPGTEAGEHMDDDVPAEVKSQRISALIDRVQATARERLSRHVGTVQEVLVEGPSRTAYDGTSLGVTGWEAKAAETLTRTEELFAKYDDLTDENIFALGLSRFHDLTRPDDVEVRTKGRTVRLRFTYDLV